MRLASYSCLESSRFFPSNGFIDLFGIQVPCCENHGHPQNVPSSRALPCRKFSTIQGDSSRINGGHSIRKMHRDYKIRLEIASNPLD
jgi:hypothetical protein